ncbi:uncharacterized protein SOCE26_077180 [Sorangium cellulosum]|uniref:Phosphoenolpyruvate--protein phosphotransferase n=1 Tax=Sorangium cellulosum TaxID=56 RepID=A0A2L0F3V5_SORCE|nr:hypothetical protein [Sorangium cellulosum]AUX46213.1 uncharacterized protein SOCE26_077180 [Sorangium cellulosum]
MGKAAFLARRLPPTGCIVAGTKLAAHREALKSKKIKLAAKVEAAIQSVLAATESLEALGSTDATMMEIDRGADRCIGAFSSQLDSIARAFDHDGILPLSDEEAIQASMSASVSHVASGLRAHDAAQSAHERESSIAEAR